jgi:hypothetical protein
MIGGIIALIVGLAAISIAWKFSPIVIKKMAEVYSLDVLHKVMLFLSVMFGLFLCWIGMPAFGSTLKFFMFGRSFSDLFNFWIFKNYASQMGGVLFWISTFGLWSAVNGCEQYPHILKSNREALEGMLIEKQKAKKITKNPDDDAETLMLKRSIRRLPGLSLINANIICGIAFVIDTAIAVINTPILKAEGDWMSAIVLGDSTMLNWNNIGILFLLVAGMSLNLMMFDQFNGLEKLLDKKASRPE